MHRPCHVTGLVHAGARAAERSRHARPGAILAAVLEGGDVIGLEGGLGAGKTTFARGAVHALGVPEETAVTSPTFALLHQYEGRFPSPTRTSTASAARRSSRSWASTSCSRRERCCSSSGAGSFPGWRAARCCGSSSRSSRTSRGALACVRRARAAMRSSVPSLSGFRAEGFPVAGPWGLW